MNIKEKKFDFSRNQSFTDNAILRFTRTRNLKPFRHPGGEAESDAVKILLYWAQDFPSQHIIVPEA